MSFLLEGTYGFLASSSAAFCFFASSSAARRMLMLARRCAPVIWPMALPGPPSAASWLAIFCALWCIVDWRRYSANFCEETSRVRGGRRAFA